VNLNSARTELKFGARTEAALVYRYQVTPGPHLYALWSRALLRGFSSRDSEDVSELPFGLLTAYKTSSTRFEIPSLSKMGLAERKNSVESLTD
jgi:hypothetical protein